MARIHVQSISERDDKTLNSFKSLQDLNFNKVNAEQLDEKI